MQIKDVTKKYNGKPVVDAVNLEIPKGKVISFIGPNGAGKSTVMGIISRLIAKDSGLVSFDGTELEKWKSKELSKRLAILTQSNNIQMNVFLTRETELPKKMKKSLSKPLLIWNLKRFETDSLMNYPVDSVSVH